MSKREKLLILSPRFPYPLEKGDKLRLFYQIKFLASTFDIYLISLTETAVADVDKAQLDKLCRETIILQQKSMLNFRAGIRAFLKKEPLQISYYYDREIQKTITQHVDRINPDVIFVQLIRMAEYATSYSQPKLLDYMDAMSLNMHREHNIRKFPFSWIYKREAKLLRIKERYLAPFFDARIIISERDKKYLEKNGVETLIVQGNGVKYDFFDVKNIKNQPPQYDVVFVGNMGYLPNVEAAEYLVNQVAKEYGPNLKIAIAGARPHERVLKLESEHVHITGWVEDIRTAYLSAKIMVAPIFTGAGQQNKILEAMSLSMPCITTTQVNESILAECDKQILIANNPQEFAKQIEFLLNNEPQRLEIGLNARIFVERNYDWPNQVEILQNALQKLIKK